MAEIIRPAIFDTAADSQVSVSLDIGVIPPGYPGAGKFIVSLQIHPLPDRKAAEVTMQAVREAVATKLGVKLTLQGGVA